MHQSLPLAVFFFLKKLPAREREADMADKFPLEQKKPFFTGKQGCRQCREKVTFEYLSPVASEANCLYASHSLVT